MKSVKKLFQQGLKIQQVIRIDLQNKDKTLIYNVIPENKIEMINYCSQIVRNILNQASAKHPNENMEFQLINSSDFFF